MMIRINHPTHPNWVGHGKPLGKAIINSMGYNDSLPIPQYFQDRLWDGVFCDHYIMVYFAMRHADVIIPYVESFYLYDSAELPEGMWEAVVPFILNLKQLQKRAKADRNPGTPLTANDKSYRKRVQEATKRWKKEYKSEHGGSLFCC